MLHTWVLSGGDRFVNLVQFFGFVGSIIAVSLVAKEMGISTRGQALASLFSDLLKHDETADHAAIELGAMLMFAGHLSTTSEVREWIEGVA